MVAGSGSKINLYLSLQKVGRQKNQEVTPDWDTSDLVPGDISNTYIAN